MARTTEKKDDIDVESPRFWNSMGFELLEVTKDGKILVKDKVTKSKMTFNTNWNALRIAKAISNARAQWIKR